MKPKPVVCLAEMVRLSVSVFAVKARESVY